MKPPLFLDVDGCLLVDPKKAPKGYVTVKLRGNDYAYSQDLPSWLHLLEACCSLVWASHGWRGHEDKDLSPLFGLPPGLDQLGADAPDPPSPRDMNPAKLAAIEAYAGLEPCVVVDDRMGPDVDAWAKGRPVLLIQPDHHVGLTEAQALVIQAFARTQELVDWPPELTGLTAKQAVC